MMIVSVALSLCLLVSQTALGASERGVRETLVEVLLQEDADAQIEGVQKLVDVPDPFVEQTLVAWRQGAVFIHESADGKKVPFLLDAVPDASGKARGLRIADGQPVLDDAGQSIRFETSELTPVDTSSKLRRAIKATMDLLTLANPNPNMRRDAITKLGLDQISDYLPYFEARLKIESVRSVQRALQEAIAITRLASDNVDVCQAAVERLGAMRSIAALENLKKILTDAKSAAKAHPPDLVRATRTSIVGIENYMAVGNFMGTCFRGLSLSAVLLVAAIGLAITFGLMGIINMAHGEVIMVGAYSAYVTQNYFVRWFGPAGGGFDCYFIAALVFSFLVGGVVGWVLERGIIRFLYKRPLESLLATWGVSLILQQLMRATFGAANVQVNSPSWLTGNVSYHDVIFAYNRIFVIVFAVSIVLGTWALLTKTALGLQVRAVMQNRTMAACMGVRTDRVNMMTFAFGSGLAGVAGACLSQIGNVGPSLGQSHIVDCFMIVVLGGVGNLIGTVCASLGIGVTDQVLQPYLGAVLGKISILAAIILFLQWRPAGLFAMRSRSLEA